MKYISNLVFLFISLMALNAQNTENNDNIKILDYYHDGIIYSIEENEVNFKVVIKEILYCKKAPCDPIIIEEKKIENEEDCKNLKSLFTEIFETSKTNKISLFDDDEFLTAEQFQLIIKVLHNIQILLDFGYEIIDNNELYNKKFHKKGYFEEDEDDKSIIYTIAMGQMPNSGYSINIQKIKLKFDLAIVYVMEKRPGPDETFDDVLTYPIIKIKFNQKPNKITIINYETGEEYPCLNC